MLPIPNGRSVEEFRVLYFEKVGIQLTDEEALDAATHALQIFYLKHYPNRPNRCI